MKEVFSKTNAKKLPPYRENVDMTIGISDRRLLRAIPKKRFYDKEKIEKKNPINFRNKNVYEGAKHKLLPISSLSKSLILKT